MTRKHKYWIFRYASSRGTDCRRGFFFKNTLTNKEALDYAIAWAEKCSAGTACQEYTVTVRPIKYISKAKARKSLIELGKKKTIIENKYKDANAIDSMIEYRNYT